MDARKQVFEERLMHERERAMRSLRRARRDDETDGSNDREPARYSQHMAEAGAEMQEQETANLVASREGERIVAIDAALRLLRDSPERYFTCEECRRPIEEPRLEFLPWTRLCAADARRGEA